MKERMFVKKAKEFANLEEFVKAHYAGARISSVEIQHTPIVTRIVIYTTTPGLVIGTGGERIQEIVEEIKKKFEIENPQIDVQRIDEPDLDPNIVAQSIASSLERGSNFKSLGNFTLERVMRSGAIGCEITMAGKVTGQRSRTERFVAGYLKKCGDTSIENVDKGFALANPKLGNIGVTVKIMKRNPKVIDYSKFDSKPETEKEKKKHASEKQKAEELESEAEHEIQDEKKEALSNVDNTEVENEGNEQ